MSDKMATTEISDDMIRRIKARTANSVDELYNNEIAVRVIEALAPRRDGVAPLDADEQAAYRQALQWVSDRLTARMRPEYKPYETAVFTPR